MSSFLLGSYRIFMLSLQFLFEFLLDYSVFKLLVGCYRLYGNYAYFYYGVPLRLYAIIFILGLFWDPES